MLAQQGELQGTVSEDVCLQVPCLTYGMRGMIAASVEVKGPARDLHSGNDGGRHPLSAHIWRLLF